MLLFQWDSSYLNHFSMITISVDDIETVTKVGKESRSNSALKNCGPIRKKSCRPCLIERGPTFLFACSNEKRSLEFKDVYSTNENDMDRQ